MLTLLRNNLLRLLYIDIIEADKPLYSLKKRTIFIELIQERILLFNIY